MFFTLTQNIKGYRFHDFLALVPSVSGVIRQILFARWANHREKKRFGAEYKSAKIEHRWGIATAANTFAGNFANNIAKTFAKAFTISTRNSARAHCPRRILHVKCLLESLNKLFFNPPHSQKISAKPKGKKVTSEINTPNDCRPMQNLATGYIRRRITG